MRVRDCMSCGVAITTPQTSVREAAIMMKESDAGALPVAENDRLVGIITDRDIVVRAVADGKWASTLVREVMTPEIHYCSDDDDLNVVAQRMGELRVRRLPVLNCDKRLVGIVSLGDISQSGHGRAAMALKDIAVKGRATPAVT
jgi:CBS domain-containing protein